MHRLLDASKWHQYPYALSGAWLVGWLVMLVDWSVDRLNDWLVGGRSEGDGFVLGSVHFMCTCTFTVVCVPLMHHPA